MPLVRNLVCGVEQSFVNAVIIYEPRTPSDGVHMSGLVGRDTGGLRSAQDEPAHTGFPSSTPLRCCRSPQRRSLTLRAHSDSKLFLETT